MSNKNPYNDKSKEERNQLVLKYIPAVKKMAYKLNERLPSNIEFDELYSIGIEELVKRSKFYDSTLNDNFWGYSKKRIYGSMLDFLRSLDTISRSSRKLVKSIDKEINKYFNEHDTNPSNEYLAEVLEESIEKIREAKIASEIYSVMPMSEQLHAFDNSDILENVEHDLLIEKITTIIDSFKERERLIIQLYYLEELSLKEISETLDITQSRISQIHRAIVIKIRNMLGVDDA